MTIPLTHITPILNVNPPDPPASPFAFDRFPSDIQVIILSCIKQLGAPFIAKMMLLSKDMHDHFGKMLYRSVKVTGKNADKIFYGVILEKLIKRSQNDYHISDIQLCTSLDYAILDPILVSSHARKIELAQQIKHITFEDTFGAIELEKILSGTALIFTPILSTKVVVNDCETLKHPEVLLNDNGSRAPPLLSNLTAVVIQSSVIEEAIEEVARANEGLPITHGRSHSGLSILNAGNIYEHWFDLQGQLGENPTACLTLPSLPCLPSLSSETNRLESSAIQDFLPGWYYQRSVILHGAWWDIIEEHRIHTDIQINFIDCTCPTCCTPLESSLDLEPLCPFSLEQLAKFITERCVNRQLYSKPNNIQLLNVPKCTANTPWKDLKELIQKRISLFRNLPPEYKIERNFVVWKEIFESYKLVDKKVKACECCGKA